MTNLITKKLLASISAILILSIPLLAGVECVAGGQEEVIATLNGEPIYLSDVEQRVAFQVYRLRGNIYTLLKRETDQIVDQRLLEAEAARSGVTVEELLKNEVDQKVPPFEEKQVDAYLVDHPEEGGGVPERRARIRTYLSERARIQRKLDFLAMLRRKADVRFVLEPPQRPRIKIDIQGQPWRGSADGPVTLVHFAGFTSELCAESAQRIRKLMAEFPGKIRWVHRNYFSIHDERALSAAEMGESAHDQGEFWDFHDLIFAKLGEFDLEALTNIASEIGLDGERLAKGRKTGRYLLEVKDDIGYAARIGVTGVPVIFVNGRYFSGTFPYEELNALVREELGRDVK